MAEPIRTYGPRPAGPAAPNAARSAAPAVSGASFGEALEQAQLRFSNHAQKRLETRGIALNDDGLARLAQAVDRAAQRGGKESLVLMDDLAFIVNVKNRLVVTAMDQQARGEGVFTQIDSVVLADKSRTQA
jgi:flagellar operon protein